LDQQWVFCHCYSSGCRLVVLVEADFAWEVETEYTLRLQVMGTRLQDWVDGKISFDVEDKDRPHWAEAWRTWSKKVT
jgi:hypothetical protein